MTVCALYARYSSTLQREASIEDQVRLCRERAAAEGWTVGEVFADRATSGASMLRPGLQGLLEEARRGRVEVVLAEALDRLSRDQADVAALYKRLSFAGVRIVTLAEGEITELHVGLKRTMNQLFLKDLAEKTRRGLRGRVEQGRSGGGNSYGYRVVRGLGPDGAPVTGEREIDPAEAEVVRRIFRDYAAGVSPRAIAVALNAEGVAGPRGGAGSASGIHGNPKRGTGLLNNELYVGRLVWNRLRYVKDPETGRRVSRPNPPDAWVTTEVPELRVVDDALWERVKARQVATALGPQPANRGGAMGSQHRPRYLLSGLLTCGACSGDMSVISATHVGCSAARNKGTCGQRRTIARVEVERRVLGALAERLMEPALFEAFCEEYRRETNRLRAEARAEAEIERRELEKVTRDLDRLVDALLDGAPVSTVKPRMEALETRRAELEAAVATRETPPPALHPKMAEVYRAKVSDLASALGAPETRAEAAEILRGLVERIALTPGPDGWEILVVGDLAGILGLASGTRNAPACGARGASQVSMVAGVGFEPTTFRL